MISTNNVVVYISPVEQIRDFVLRQPPMFGVVMTYAAICFLLFWVTRGKGYLISFLTAWLYLVPLWLH
jgi:hypothetical protein